MRYQQDLTLARWTKGRVAKNTTEKPSSIVQGWCSSGNGAVTSASQGPSRCSCNLVVPKALQTTLLNQMEALSRPRWFRVWVIDMNSAMKIVQGEGSRTDLLLLIFPNVWDIIGSGPEDPSGCWFVRLSMPGGRVKVEISLSFDLSTSLMTGDERPSEALPSLITRVSDSSRLPSSCHLLLPSFRRIIQHHVDNQQYHSFREARTEVRRTHTRLHR